MQSNPFEVPTTSPDAIVPVFFSITCCFDEGPMMKKNTPAALSMDSKSLRYIERSL